MGLKPSSSSPAAAAAASTVRAHPSSRHRQQQQPHPHPQSQQGGGWWAWLRGRQQPSAAAHGQQRRSNRQLRSHSMENLLAGPASPPSPTEAGAAGSSKARTAGASPATAAASSSSNSSGSGGPADGLAPAADGGFGGSGGLRRAQSFSRTEAVVQHLSEVSCASDVVRLAGYPLEQASGGQGGKGGGGGLRGSSKGRRSDAEGHTASLLGWTVVLRHTIPPSHLSFLSFSSPIVLTAHRHHRGWLRALPRAHPPRRLQGRRLLHARRLRHFNVLGQRRCHRLSGLLSVGGGF